MNVTISAHGQEMPESQAIKWMLGAVVLSAIVRTVCFPFTSYGGAWEYVDAPTRVAMAVRWLHHPTLLTTNDCFQFGPLHIYLTGAILSIWYDPHVAPRFLSLLFGVATIVPLFLLTRTLFGPRAAIFCGLFSGFYTLQVKCSGVAMAEAPYGFFFITSLHFLFRFRRDGRTSDMLWSACMLSLAAMTRYEAWPYIPLMGLLAIRLVPHQGGCSARTVSSLRSAVIFGGVASALPILWIVVNYLKGADPFLPWNYIPNELARVGDSMVERHGLLVAAMFYAVYVPGVLFLSLTPITSLLALICIGRCLIKRGQLAYAVVLVPYVLYYSQTLFLKAASESRLFTAFGLMILPYAGAQMDALTASLTRKAILLRTIAVLLSSAVVFIALIAITYLPSFPFQDRLWNAAPVSPLSAEEKSVMNFLRTHLKAREKIIPDSSVFARNMMFDLNPSVAETWWDMLKAQPVSPEGMRKYVQSSVPGVLLVDKTETMLDKLVDSSDQCISDFLKVGVHLIFTTPRYRVYQLTP